MSIIGKQRAQKLVKAIQESRDRGLARVLHGLIPTLSAERWAALIAFVERNKRGPER